jgi:DNA invertase Pin-like site-specific DNA recombinase
MSECSAPKRLGYARVSTVGQTLEAQLDQLKAAGCLRVYREKVSGAKVDRKELGKLLKAITAGDHVVVTRIDRLARSVLELFAIFKKIIDDGGQFLSLGEPWADTSTSTGRLMIAVLGGLADVERYLIRTRTGEGRARAKLRGGTWATAEDDGGAEGGSAAQKQERRSCRRSRAILWRQPSFYISNHRLRLRTIRRNSPRISGARPAIGATRTARQCV